jgi:site-specific DNA-methyltransferase (adenine-specific)
MLVNIKTGQATHRLYQMDCLKALPQIVSKSVDVTIQSPPYNIGKKYLSDDDNMTRPEYLHWCSKWLTDIYRIQKDEGHFFLNVGSKPSSPLGPFEVFAKAQQAGWVLQNFLSWVKSISIDGAGPGGTPVSTGQFKPLTSDRFVNDLWEPIFWLGKGGKDDGVIEQETEWEPVFHLSKDGKSPIDRRHPDFGVPHQDQTNVTRWKAGREEGHKLRCRGNVLFAPYETIQSREERPHPASFPLRLVEMLLGLAGLSPGATVLDCFLGSGTTSVACVRKGFNSIGIEKDPDYFSAAVERVVNEAKSLQLPVEVSFTD